VKAVLLNKPGPIEKDPLQFTDVEEPKVGKGEILVRIAATGVCRSNLHMIEGDWVGGGVPSKLPIIPGHEMVGIVETIGSIARGLKVGDRVGLQPLWYADGTCPSCMMGMENVCENKLIAGENLDGGYAEFVKGKADFVYKVPEEISDETAAPLFCAGITSYSAIKKADPNKGKLIAIFGIGGVGHLAVEFAKQKGARVAAVSREPIHLKIADRMGADIQINSSESDPVEVLKKRGYADASVIFAPSAQVVATAMRATKPGGTVVLGVDTKIETGPILQREVNVKGTLIGTRKLMKELLNYAVKNNVEIEAETYPLREANQVLKKLKNSKIKGRAILKP
jgi:propanol-preferring alcohol dehydrogenase